MRFATSYLPFLLLSLSARALSTVSSCSCTAAKIPVPVDISVPADPSQGLNTTNLRRLQATYGIFGALCQPSSLVTPTAQGAVQLLLHGSSYTSHYWNFDTNGFQNYSYVDHACAQGHTTFAYDTVGVGLSDRPDNSTDIQIPTSATIVNFLAQQLKSGGLTQLLGIQPQSFDKVIAIGHSQGSVVFNYVAIANGSTTPIDAMILTGHLHDPAFVASRTVPRPAARDVDPVRWGNLDPGYISTSNRTQYYPPNNNSYSQDMLSLDQLTKDISTLWYTLQLQAVFPPATGFTGPVVELVGAFDQVHCFNGPDGFQPCNATALTASEKPFYPDSRNFSVIVRDGSGHDVNLDFGAAETFNVYTSLVNSFAA